MKRLTSVALFVMMGFALTAPMLAHAGASNDQQKQQQKQYKEYRKNQNKAKKKQLKDEKNQIKKWNKDHRGTTTTVT